MPLPKPPPEPTPPPAETFAVTLPGMAPVSDGNSALAPAATSADAAQPARVNMTLLLPLRSDTLGPAAAALRAGFMAAWQQERAQLNANNNANDSVNVTVIDTGDVPQDVLASYARAQQHDDIIIGPLGRAAVGAVATSALVQKPTIALNTPEGYGTADAVALPAPMLVMGLSIEEEARQAAQWAATDHPGATAFILSTSTPWQRRVAAAFAAQWQRAGLPHKLLELSAPDGYLSDPELMQLRARLRDNMPGLLFSAMGADQTRQLRGALADAAHNEPSNPIFSTADALPPAPILPSLTALPLYGTSALNAGLVNNNPNLELDGVRLLDLPWQLQRDHPSVQAYPQPQQTGSADLERLYALGIDAYRVARTISRQPVGRFQLDGVTGRLNITYGQGAASFERIEQPAIFDRGVAQPVMP